MIQVVIQDFNHCEKFLKMIPLLVLTIWKQPIQTVFWFQSPVRIQHKICSMISIYVRSWTNRCVNTTLSLELLVPKHADFVVSVYVFKPVLYTTLIYTHPMTSFLAETTETSWLSSFLLYSKLVLSRYITKALILCTWLNYRLVKECFLK